MNDIARSKFLSLVLRHEPRRAGITLDSAGWTDIEILLRGCAKAGFPMTRDDLRRVVDTNSKKRFALSEDGKRIRANQGHSVEVDLEYKPVTPPEYLYHGTATRFLDSIRNQGLHKQARHHVHLSADEKTAITVGARHGKAVVLKIRAGEMHRAGRAFYLSTNGVWLTDDIEPGFIVFP